jgi:hypothetical protein
MLFNQLRSRRFNYIPKHIKERNDVLDNDYDTRLQNINRLNKQRRKRASNLPILIIILVLLIFLLYYLNSYEN